MLSLTFRQEKTQLAARVIRHPQINPSPVLKASTNAIKGEACHPSRAFLSTANSVDNSNDCLMDCEHIIEDCILCHFCQRQGKPGCFGLCDRFPDVRSQVLQK